MMEALEASILAIIKDGGIYKVSDITHLTGARDGTVRVILDRLEARRVVTSNRDKTWATYRIQDAPIVPAPKIDLLHRKPYQQTGPAWDRVRQQVEQARLGKSRHV